jgi:hypothetical protein
MSTAPTTPVPQLERRWLYGNGNQSFVAYELGVGGPCVATGNGDPNTLGLVAPLGSLFLRQDGGASTSLYVATGPATWTAK